jgi:hypothetical protein
MIYLLLVLCHPTMLCRVWQRLQASNGSPIGTTALVNYETDRTLHSSSPASERSAPKGLKHISLVCSDVMHRITYTCSCSAQTSLHFPGIGAG